MHGHASRLLCCRLVHFKLPDLGSTRDRCRRPSRAAKRRPPQLSAVDGDEHFIEMPPPVRPWPFSSELARNDRAELQSPVADGLAGYIDATLGEHIPDIAVAQSEAKVEPDGLLNNDARKAVSAV